MLWNRFFVVFFFVVFVKKILLKMPEIAAIASLHKKYFHSLLFKDLASVTEFFDVEIWVNGTKLLAHRLVLAFGSPVFYEMLKNVEPWNRMPTFVFNDVKLKHMKSIIGYLYNGETEVASTDLEEFFRVAKKLKIIGLYSQPEPDEKSTHDDLIESVKSDIVPSKQYSVVYNLTDTDINGGKSRDELRNGASRQLGVSHSSQRPSKRTQSNSPQSSKRTRSDSPAKDTNSTPPSATSTNENGKGDDKQRTQNKNGQTKDDSSEVEENGFRCDATDCGKEFATLELLQLHQKKRCGKLKAFKCPVCDKSFYLRFQLSKHQCNRNNVSNSQA